MKVTGHLKEPVLEPCPNRDDLQTLVDDTCVPVQCTRPRNVVDVGADCCEFWTSPDTWQNTQIRVDQIDPEKFQYEQYRYQLYAKPASFDCRHGVATMERIPDQEYVAPVTDIRALRQFTTVPVMGNGGGMNLPAVPSNPAGVAEVTFPMTEATLGQPDVTTACCVPVVPCQQGYHNLTPQIIQHTRCIQVPPPGRPKQKLGHQRQDPCADNAACSQKQQAQEDLKRLQQARGREPYGPAVYRQPGGRGPEMVFNQQQAYVAPQVQPLQVPKPDFSQPQQAAANGAKLQGPDYCFDPRTLYASSELEDGMNPKGGVDTMCTNVSTFRFQDRVMREFHEATETPEQRRERLTRMSGSYGSALQPKQSGKRPLAGPKDNIVQQGNGFNWGGYPQHKNKLCYVLERNLRC